MGIIWGLYRDHIRIMWGLYGMGDCQNDGPFKGGYRCICRCRYRFVTFMLPFGVLGIIRHLVFRGP